MLFQKNSPLGYSLLFLVRHNSGKPRPCNGACGQAEGKKKRQICFSFMKSIRVNTERIREVRLHIRAPQQKVANAFSFVYFWFELMYLGPDNGEKFITKHSSCRVFLPFFPASKWLMRKMHFAWNRPAASEYRRRSKHAPPPNFFVDIFRQKWKTHTVKGCPSLAGTAKWNYRRISTNRDVIASIHYPTDWTANTGEESRTKSGAANKMAEIKRNKYIFQLEVQAIWCSGDTVNQFSPVRKTNKWCVQLNIKLEWARALLQLRLFPKGLINIYKP